MSSDVCHLFQARHSVCHTCRGYELRLHACLSCVYFGCYEDNHIQEHAYKNEHWLGKLDQYRAIGS